MTGTRGGAPPLDRRRGDPRLSATGEQRVHEAVLLAFRPLHKAALGVAVGIVLGAVLGGVTLLDLVLDPRGVAQLDLLAQYFAGYTVSPAGSAIAAAWGLAVGFVAGWFMAFVRNAAMAAWVLYIRARAEWKATSDFLDYV